MRLVIENLNEEVIRQMALVASQHGSTPEEEAAAILSNYFSRASVIEKLKKMHVEMLAERGGVPFPDSVEFIREMREND